MKFPDVSDSADFLLGGGEMGARIRAHNWASTSLGPPRTWPQSLRTAVRIMLTSRQPFWIGWGEELTYLYNDPYMSIIGGRHPWALGKPVREIWSEIWSDIQPMLDTAMTGVEGTYVEEQLLIMERNGYPEETYYTFSYSPVPDDDGKPGGIICANTEDTSRVIGERQLKLLRELSTGPAEARNWEDACRKSAEALCTDSYDVPFALIYGADQDGYGADQDGASLVLQGSCGIERDHPAAPERLPAAGGGLWPVAESVAAHQVQLVSDLASRFDEALPTGAWSVQASQAAVLPIPTSGETGRAAALVVGLNPFRLFDEDYRRFLAFAAAQIGTAMSNAQAYEEERRRAEALAEIDRVKTQFFSNVSHEFRTPLTLMLGPLEELLEEPALSGDHRREIQVIQRNGLRLLRLVNALLDFSRVEAGRAQAVYQPVDLATFTGQLASSFKSACEKAGLRFDVDCNILPQPVFIDREMWEKVVFNLLSNAFKFTFHGRIGIAVRGAEGYAELTVSDTGTGIPADDLTRIFERFHRIDGAQGRTHEGTGIGLALVQELVKLHGGTVEVESVLGKGTRFIVRIPFGSGHLPPDRIGTAHRQTSTAVAAEAYVEEALRWLFDDVPVALESDTEGEEDPLSPGERKPRILLADDSADMREYVRRLLARRYDVEVVSDGRAALEAAHRDPPDLVLTDVMMPRLDGYGLLEALRADDRTKECLVILLSARAGEDVKAEGLHAGADDYVVKPFAARELLTRIEAHLKMQRVRREAQASLRESEARFRHMADHAPVMVWVTDPDGSCTFLSRSWYDFTGQTPTTGLGFGWIDAVHPGDRKTVREAFTAASGRREPFSIDYRLRRADGQFHWAIDTARPRFAEDGAFLGYIGSVIDIHDRKRAEQHRNLLVDELNHRVKNTLAVVQGLAMHTFKAEDASQNALTAFEGRLAALAGAHNLLTQSNWESARLDELAARALDACGAASDRVAIAGPDVVLPPKAAVTMAMAFHELCTNAVKYGALSNERGRVDVTWQVSGSRDPILKLQWRERDGPSVVPPTTRGFGSAMIERALAHDLDGEVNMEFLPGGVACRIDAPLPTFEEARH